MKKWVALCFLIMSANLLSADLVNSLHQLNDRLKTLRQTIQQLHGVPAIKEKPAYSMDFTIKNQPLLEQTATQLFKNLTQQFIPLYEKEMKTFEDLLKNLNINYLVQHYASDLNQAVDSKTVNGQSAFQQYLQDLLKEYAKTFWFYRFGWCSCVSFGKRLVFMLQLLQNIKDKYRDTTQNLVYTTLGSGLLMQDYLTLWSLIKAGYHDITINLIDLGYSELPVLTLKEEQQLKEREIEKREKEAAQLEHFEQLLKALSPAIEVTVYNDATSYKYRAQKYNAFKSNILVMVDPMSGLDELIIPPYPSQANVVARYIYEISNQVPAIYIFIPRNGGIQVYALKKGQGERALNNILDIVQQAATQIKYLEWLYLAQYKEGVKQGKIQVSWEEFIEEKKIIQKLPRSIKALERYEPFFLTQLLASRQNEQPAFALTTTQKNQPVPLTLFLADPFITFQELLLSNILAPQAVVYTLDREKSKTGFEKTNEIRKINVEEYKKKDVVTPYHGNILEQDYDYYKVNLQDR